jgi:hypothetical protein
MGREGDLVTKIDDRAVDWGIDDTRKPPEGCPTTYETRVALDDSYRPLGSDCGKWKKSSGSYLFLTRTKWS